MSVVCCQVDISSLRVNDLTFILLTWRKWLAPNDASREQMGFNSGFKGLSRFLGQNPKQVSIAEIYVIMRAEDFKISK